MPLMNPTRQGGFLLTDTLAGNPGAGTTITAHATIHTKGATPTELIASTTADAYGIQIHVHNNASANNSTATLLDIMTGAASSEVVLIPDLMAGWVINAEITSNMRTYYFPIFIPAGTRISARSQSLITSRACTVAFTLMERPTQLGFVGSRVTAYGVNAATSYGILHTAGTTSAYGATAGILSASTTNPIRYMQIGVDPSNRTTVADAYGWYRLQLGTNVLIDDLKLIVDTGTESIGFDMANSALSTQLWNFPAGVDLRYAISTSGAVSFSSIVYGVD